MELPIDATVKCEVRAIIWSLNAKCMKPFEIHRQLTEVYGESFKDVKNVRKCCMEFAAGRTEFHDEERSGRPSISDLTITKVEKILREDRWISLDDFCILVPEVSRITIHRVLSEKLQYLKVCTKRVPPYSLHLAPSDYHLFPNLNEHFAGTCFSNEDEVKDEVERFLNDMTVTWYSTVWYKLHMTLRVDDGVENILRGGHRKRSQWDEPVVFRASVARSHLIRPSSISLPISVVG
uniref:Mos1 transposase HTH domain-containing protein n=1 Tax=Octopus bimaculoides TaxID=37653 RepID=A0A0L8GNT4_OCTBM